MASLLSWAKKTVQHIAHDVNNDVVHPVQRAVAQINPADNNRTWKNPQGNAPQQQARGQAPPSAFRQITHSGASNFVGNNFAKPLAQFPIDASNQIYNKVVAPVIHAPNLTPQQVTPIRTLAKNVGATGSLHQTIGSGIQTGLTLASGGLAGGIEKGVASLLPKTAPKLVANLAPKIASNAALGAGFNASAAVSQGAKPVDIAKAAAVGAGLGAATPIAGVAAKVGVTSATRGLEKVNASPAGQKLAAFNQKVPVGLGIKDVNKGDKASIAPETKTYQTLPRVKQTGLALDQPTGSAPLEQPRIESPTQSVPEPTKAELSAAFSNDRGSPATSQQQSVDRTGLKESQPLSAQTSSANNSTELDKTIQSQLKSGNVDNAVNSVIQARGVSLQDASRYVSRVADQSGIDLGAKDASKNPLVGKVQVPTVSPGDHVQALNNANFVRASEHTIGSKGLDSFNALSTKDKLLLRNIENKPVSEVAKRADNPAAFTQAEKDIRTYYNTRHAYDRYLGIDVGYRTNYLRHVFDQAQHPDVGQISVKGSGRRPGYTKTRTGDALAKDVSAALQKDIKGSSFNHAKLTYEKGLNEAYPGKVANGELVRDSSGVYRQLTNKFGQELSLPKDIAHEINSRSWGENASKALNTYDKINHGLKYVKLSGGFFHAFTEAGNFTGQQLASGKLFSNPAATGKLFKVFFNSKAMTGEIKRFTETGVLDNAHLAGLTTRADQILADVNVSALDKAGGKLAKYSGVKAIHDATFQREIPYAKLKIFEQKTQGMSPHNPADLAKMRSIARETNQMFGGINREIQGIKPDTFKWLQRGLLATDFTEGKWHTLIDALHAGGEAGKLARQAVIGKSILFGVMATAGAAAGGEFKGQSPGQVAKNAAGNLLDPTFEIGGYKAKLPKTFISEAVGAVKPTQQATGAPWNASGLLSYASARSAALPSELQQLASNKDYYGQPIYGKNSKKNGGAPISPANTGVNLLNTVAPIPFGQGVKTANNKQSLAAGIANVAGLNVRPNPANTVSLQGVNTTLSDPQRRQYESLLTNAQKSIVSQLTNSAEYKALTPNQQQQALTNVKGYTTTAINRQFASKNSLGQYAPNFTGKGTQANAKEQQVISGKITPSDFFPKSAGSATTSAKTKGNSYNLPNGTKVDSSALDKTYSGNSVRLTTSKNSGDITGYMQTAQGQLKNISDQLNNPKIDPVKAQKLANQAQTLQTEINKYSAYGGFTKPAKVASYKGIGTISGARTDYVANITKSAAKHGVDINAALAVAAAEGLGGGVGDNGTSYGPFQLHQGGALPKGATQQWAESPAGIDYALQQISKVTQGKSGQAAVEAIVNSFERPADPSGEIARAMSVYTGGKAQLTPGASRSGTFVASGSSTRTGSKKATGGSQVGLTAALNATKALNGPKVASKPSFKVKTSTSTYHKAPLKQYAVKKSSVSKGRGKLA